MVNGAKLRSFSLLLIALLVSGSLQAATLVVANKAEATVSLVNLATGKVAATLPVGVGPHEVAISPDGRRALVANYGDHEKPGSTLTLIDVPGARVAKLWNENDPKGVRADLLDRVRRRLTALNGAQDLPELNLPGWGLHRLQGKPVRFALAVNGPWRITFEWEDGDALRVDLEQYH